MRERVANQPVSSPFVFLSRVACGGLHLKINSVGLKYWRLTVFLQREFCLNNRPCMLNGSVSQKNCFTASVGKWNVKLCFKLVDKGQIACFIFKLRKRVWDTSWRLLKPTCLRMRAILLGHILWYENNHTLLFVQIKTDKSLKTTLGPVTAASSFVTSSIFVYLSLPVLAILLKAWLGSRAFKLK